MLQPVQISNDILLLSGSDLVGHLNCRHLTELENAVAKGLLKKSVNRDPLLQILWERGLEHEKAYVEHLRSAGFEVVEIAGVGVEDQLVEATLKAMQSGVAIIVQGAFKRNGWVGRTDILRRVETPSALGAWSYEVIDTKLATETKGGTVLQLCLYSDMVGASQGLIPEYMHVVTPWSDFAPESYRVADYAAYYRCVKVGLERSVAEDTNHDIYPEPKGHCDICHWRGSCETRRRNDDHLCLVAGISKTQINELNEHGVRTTTELSAMPLPLAWKPDRGSAHSYARIREQARVQIQGRTSGTPIYEALPIMQGFGLTCLPAPSPGDIFFDLEGDPFVGQGGLEFLFGYVVINDEGKPEYTGNWVASREDEKHVFERFVDFVIERLERYPDLHIYHYAPYEPGALKRLMGRYATREEEIDRMLRAKLFVDLYGVVRHAVRASVESYSIKRLEQFYGYERRTPLADANIALVRVQACMELNNFPGITDDLRKTVSDYNRDDCVSTQELRNWLEQIRAGLIAQGQVIDRPPPGDGAPSENISEWLEKINALIARLTHDVPVDVEERTVEQHARWILANILDWHRREDKAVWWEYFRLCDLGEEDLLDERAGLAGLEFIENVGGTAKAPIHRYRFPAQETELRGGETLNRQGGEKHGKVESIDLEQRTVDIKKRGDSASNHSDAVFAHDVVGTKEQAAALVRIGEYVADHGLVGVGPYHAARDLLLKEAPRIGGQAIRIPGESTVQSACRVGVNMEGGVLPIQGPPGAGKTFTGGRMICDLVRAGKKVGITANSHKVIRNLLNAVVEASVETGVALCCIQKASEKEEDQERLIFAKTNEDVFSALQRGSCQVAGGTAWLWSREDAFDSVDVLVVDEAAQMSLANVLAISHAAKSIVLLGDPQQLDQPMKGSHPEGTDVSALDHILDGHQTIQADKGLFLEETWRLHPDICRFTSELFYEGRLQPRGGLEQQEIRSSGVIRGAGLRYLPVTHEGNQSSSPEEAHKIRDLVTNILNSGTTWIDRAGEERPLELKDVLIIAPYNAQVFEIQGCLPGARVGTVDKFQGQEAPIAIYSMTTSTHADAPRGMEFLYSLNRLNVATSRAKCVCVVVGSPQLFEAECRTPRQIQLANAFCRYLELAERLSL